MVGASVNALRQSPNAPRSLLRLAGLPIIKNVDAILGQTGASHPLIGSIVFTPMGSPPLGVTVSRFRD